MNLSHIVEGWSKTLGLMKVSEEEKQLSEARMKICAGCPFASESKFLKLVGEVFDNVGSIYCTQCGCPTNEKTQVPREKCPAGKW